MVYSFVTSTCFSKKYWNWFLSKLPVALLVFLLVPSYATLSYGESGAGYLPTEVALDFKAVADKVTLPDIDLKEKSFTIEFWARWRGVSPGNRSYILSQGDPTSGNGLHMGFHDATVFRCSFWGSKNEVDSNYDGNNVAYPADNKWHHWACSYDKNDRMKQRLYRDGKFLADNHDAGKFMGSGPIRLNWLANGQNNLFDGSVDEIRIWDSVRTETQLRENMDKRLPDDQTGLIALYRLDSEGTTIVDSISEQNGTKEGGSWVNVSDTNQERRISQQFGSGNYIHGGTYDLSKHSFAVEFWASRDSTGREDFAVEHGELVENRGLKVGFKSNDTFTCDFFGNALVTDKQFPETDWHQWACVFDYNSNGENGTRTIYRDGVVVATDSSVSPYEGSGTLKIGKSFSGKLDEVRIWKIAPTDKQILGNMERKIDINSKDFYAYFPIDRPDTVSIWNMAGLQEGFPISLSEWVTESCDNSSARWCNNDEDTDSVVDWVDNCPFTPNADQANADGNAWGNVCDGDQDGDGVPDDKDNCPATANADQLDTSRNGVGDICDPDRDGDGFNNDVDTCPDLYNKEDQLVDRDKDNIGDACDPDTGALLQVVSPYGTVVVSPTPDSGTGLYTTGTTVHAEVSEALAFDIKGHSVAPDSSDAVVRHTCVGFSVAGTVQEGSGNAFDFNISEDTTILFKWKTEYVLDVLADLSQANITTGMVGNPSPSVGRTWLSMDELVNLQIDGAVEDSIDPDERSIVSGYQLTGGSVNSALTHGELIPTEISLRLNGAHEYVELFSLDGGGQAVPSFTIELWARRDYDKDSNSGEDQYIVTQGDSVSGGMHMGFNSDNHFTCSFYNNSVTSPSQYTDQHWHHWACSYDKDVRKGYLFRDGDLLATVDDIVPFQGRGSLYIGHKYESDSFFRGQVDELRVWAKARTADTIKRDMLRRLDGGESSLVVYYRFDQPAADITFEATGKNEGRLYNMTVFDNWVIATDSANRIAMAFSGTDGEGNSDYIEIKEGDVHLVDRSFTLEAWVRNANTGNENIAVVGQGVAKTNEGLFMGFRDSNAFTCGFYENDLDTTHVWNDSDWHHWACVFEFDSVSYTGKRTIYRDGVMVATDQEPVRPYQGSGKFYLGRSPWDSYFEGEVDEIRVWNVARSTTQIRTNKNISLQGEEKGLVAYYPIDRPFFANDGVDVIRDAKIEASQKEIRYGIFNNMDIAAWRLDNTYRDQDFEVTDSRLQLPQFIMQGPGSVTYNWKSQYRVVIETTTEQSKEAPLVQEVDSKGNIITQYEGSGIYWFDHNSRVRLLAPAKLCTFDLIGWKGGSGLPDYFNQEGLTKELSIRTINGIDYVEIDLGEIKSAVEVTWNYGDTEGVFYETVTLGNSIAFSGVPSQLLRPWQPVDITQSRITAKPPIAIEILEAPDDTTEADIYVWGGLEKKTYPLRPSRFRLDWEVNCPAGDPAEGTDITLVTEITSVWPVVNHYTHIASTPATLLDRKPDDNFTFFEHAYKEASSDAVIDGTHAFKATTRGRNVLVFTHTDVGTIATGSTEMENVSVRVVGTELWGDKVKSERAVIGDNITSNRHDPNVPHNGYLFFHGLARYNSKLYDPLNLTGPIIPVNQQFTTTNEDDLVVVWYKQFGGDPIFWPYQAVNYQAQWPQENGPGIVDDDPHYGQRIVVASRFGSDGKDFRDYEDQLKFDPGRYQELMIYNQPDLNLPGYNPNEEHALLADSYRYKEDANRPTAAFALRNDLNTYQEANHDQNYTSDPYVLLQYFDTEENIYKMAVYKVEMEDISAGYVFTYPMQAGEPVVPFYPLNLVIGATPPSQIHGLSGDPDYLSYWEDHKGQPWGVSGGSHLFSFFWYPMAPEFWFPSQYNKIPGDILPFSNAGPLADQGDEIRVRYDLQWPDDLPILRVGETLTYGGGEERADFGVGSGLPGVLGWAAGQVVFDSVNPSMEESKLQTDYSGRLAPVLTDHSVSLPLDIFPLAFQPAAGKTENIQGLWYFTELHAGLKKRVFYDPLLGQLFLRGFINDKTVGDQDLTQDPPSIYVLQPNILTPRERDDLLILEGAETNFRQAVWELYYLSRDPENVSDEDIYTVGLEREGDTLIPSMALGAGLALMPNQALLDPENTLPEILYLTLAENNNEALGDAPVALHIIKIDQNRPYRGAIKTVLADNVFDEKITLKHSGDFGGEMDKLVFEWWYREEDGIRQEPPRVYSDPACSLQEKLPNPALPGTWSLFSDLSGKNGLGMNEIVMAGTGHVLLVDNLFFSRYRHQLCDPTTTENCWSGWAGAANNRSCDTPPDYRAQLVEGWVKRVVKAVNPFDARMDEFSGDSPATYTSMIQQAGAGYEGPVALNSDKNIIENVGLIELYQTVLKRAADLSINLSQPASTSGVTSALLLASSRLGSLNALLGNEAYSDAINPTIGFTTTDGTYGNLAPSIFTFMNQVPDLLDEELSLLRGRAEKGARPVYNRMLWNFTIGRGEAAYALNYGIKDVDDDGFINETDAQILYPQGHGDAWGHFLSAMQPQYELLSNKDFNWEARSEMFQIQGVTLNVDYLDERKFAEIAAAKAKVGSSVVDLTYRQRYVEDPDGQWQGYEDTDSDRAWGVSGWGRRAGTGTLFDWITANAIVPSSDTDPTHTGIKKIERSTLPELQEIANQARQIQSKVDQADGGLNPLGLVVDGVPFDIDPTRVDLQSVNPATHFEQIYERAIKAASNARTVFDYANTLNGNIAGVAESTEAFRKEVLDKDRDYRNRLIEYFGTPYEGTIGSGKTYPVGYQGPDIYFYNYIDLNEVSNRTIPPPNETVLAYFAPQNRVYMERDNNTDMGNFSDMSAVFQYYLPADYPDGYDPDSTFVSAEFQDYLEIEFPITAQGYSFVAPNEWGMRRSPGRIQEVLLELVQAEADLQLVLANYAGLTDDLRLAINELEILNQVDASTVQLTNRALDKKVDLMDYIHKMELLSEFYGWASDNVNEVAEAISEALPTSVGFSTDATAPARSAIEIAGTVLSNIYFVESFIASEIAVNAEQELDLVDDRLDSDVGTEAYRYDIQQLLHEIEGILGNESPTRVAVFRSREHMRQVSEKYKTVLGDGVALLQERQVFNKQAASKVQGERYQDMAFRLNRNNALSEYHTVFDLAARYTYMAAKAYEYETNLGENHPASAQPLLTRIVRQRTLGPFVGDDPVVGQGGLADILARLKANYDLFKGQMGFNNPQNGADRFSLKNELFRIRDGSTNEEQDQSRENWQRELVKHRVDDLWKVPEFRRFGRSFAPESAGPQPGLVISFPSTIQFGKNFFGKPLASGEHAYDPSHFATKVRSVGVWFDNYDNTGLAETPHVYLIPVGMDVMYVADSLDLDTREWTVVDQKIPVPFPVGSDDLKNPNWVPVVDSLKGSGTGTSSANRRHSGFRAYHDSGNQSVEAMTYDSRLVGRSVWNTEWLLIIPGATFLADADEGLDTFMYGQLDESGMRNNNGVKDIKLVFQTYSISGN